MHRGKHVRKKWAVVICLSGKREWRASSWDSKILGNTFANDEAANSFNLCNSVIN